MNDLIVLTALGIAALALFVALSANARVAGLSRRFDLLVRGLDPDLADRLKLSDRVKELADGPAGKIAAIKAYREETGAGLAEAKAAVELYLSSRNP